jgi:hypothetical protein
VKFFASTKPIFNFREPVLSLPMHRPILQLSAQYTL